MIDLTVFSDDFSISDAANVIPVLVSAAFLQMDPLLNDCLVFCQDHMNDILRQATNLSCLNDSIITRLVKSILTKIT